MSASAPSHPVPRSASPRSARYRPRCPAPTDPLTTAAAARTRGVTFLLVRLSLSAALPIRLHASTLSPQSPQTLSPSDSRRVPSAPLPLRTLHAHDSSPASPAASVLPG